MTDEKIDPALIPDKALIEEQDRGHKETLESLKETDQALEHAQTVISEARERLKNATKRYQERLYGPSNPQPY